MIVRIPILIALLGPVQATDKADVVITNAVVETVDESVTGAQAIAIRGDRILAVGTNAKIEALVGDHTNVIRLNGQLVIPGFIEGHGHFMSLGYAKMNLELASAGSWQEIVNRVASRARRVEPGEWIIGRGWHQEKWSELPADSVDGYPTHIELSQVTPVNPVLLTHASGHLAIANDMAMRLAGIDATTEDPPGGEIVRDERGATGILRERAQGLVQRALNRAVAKRTPEQLEAHELRAFGLATEECLSKGVTSFQDAGSSLAMIDRFKRYADQQRMKLRLWVMIRESNDRLGKHLADYRMIDHANGFLTVRGIKQMVDGALGAHGAWLLEPYSDMSNSTGLNVEPIESIQRTAQLALEHDYQLCVHAIGDRANREILDLYQMIIRTHPEKKDWRWRIEHAQHIHPTDIFRFGQLGVIASMQGNHCTSDGPYVTKRLGEQRAKYGAYAWKSLMASGATVINGTDAPVEDVNPILSYYSSVTRRMNNGSVFFGEQAMSRMEALKSYTINAAYAAFEDRQKGSLIPGKLADLVVLSDNILTCPADDIPKVKVMLTMVGGLVVFRSDAFEPSYTSPQR